MYLNRGNNGSAELVISAKNGRSAVTRAFAKSPLALLTPRAAGASVWACTSNYGGGMLGGDETSLDLKLDQGACCFLSTQASTKIYRNPRGLPCAHTFSARLDEEATLIAAPDPVQCFADAAFDQRQYFALLNSSNLVLVDWISAGRTARGERWAFKKFQSKIEIERGGKSVLFDNLLLDPALLDFRSRFGMGRFNCLATIVLLGPRVESSAKQILSAMAEEPVKSNASLVMSASPLAEGAIIRMAGESVEEMARAIASHLSFVKTLLQDDPWLRKW
jgi:urease accessory protein